MKNHNISDNTENEEDVPPAPSGDLYRERAYPGFYVRSEDGEHYRHVGEVDIVRGERPLHSDLHSFTRVENKDEDGPKIVWASAKSPRILAVDYRAGIVNGPKHPRIHIDYEMDAGLSERKMPDHVYVTTRWFDSNQNKVEKERERIELPEGNTLDDFVHDHADRMLEEYHTWVSDADNTGGLE